MDYIRLGTSGLQVSRICLGCMSYGSSKWRPWVLDEEASRPFIRRALELEINFFDTADMYSDGASEEVLGRALKEFAKRSEIVLATKVFYPMGPGPNDRGLSRKHIFYAIDASLKRLGTDYVDLYQIHRYDPETPIEETLAALHDVVRSGKARYIGVSSMWAWQFAQALALADRRGWTRFVSMQNHYNLIYREEEREMLPLCRAEGIGVIPWSPLARGLLTGSRHRGATPATERAKSDEYARAALRGVRLRGRGSGSRLGQAAWGTSRPDRPGLAITPTGRRRSDHRCDEDGTSRAGGRCAFGQAVRRGMPAARGALPTACDPRAQLAVASACSGSGCATGSRLSKSASTASLIPRGALAPAARGSSPLRDSSRCDRSKPSPSSITSGDFARREQTRTSARRAPSRNAGNAHSIFLL